MADLIIKPSAVADDFKMTDAGSTAILTVEGQTDAAVGAAGRIIYGKGVNETLGTASQASAVVTIDLATGTFFEWTLTEACTTWKILHLPAAGTIAAWVVKLTNKASPVANTWTGNAASTWDNSGTWSTTTPVFHWSGGTDHVISTGGDDIDIIGFWTKGGDNPIIYSTEIGKDFLT